jgi:hypothetical protein
MLHGEHVKTTLVWNYFIFRPVWPEQAGGCHASNCLQHQTVRVWERDPWKHGICLITVRDSPDSDTSQERRHSGSGRYLPIHHHPSSQSHSLTSTPRRHVGAVLPHRQDSRFLLCPPALAVSNRNTRSNPCEDDREQTTITFTHLDETRV